MSYIPRVSGRFVSTVALAAASLISLQARAAVGSENIDFDRVNASIRTALADISTTSDSIDTLLYSINADRTDINQDKYGFDVNLKLAKTPWDNSTLEAMGRFDIKVDAADQSDRGFTISMDATYRADALAMLKWKVKSVSHCDMSQDAAGLAGILWTRHCEYVAMLPQINTVSGLYDLLTQKIAAHRADVTAYMASLQQSLTSLSQQQALDSKVEGLLRGELSKSQRVLDFLNGVDLQRTDTGFSIETPAFSGCPILSSPGLRLDVSADAVAVSGTVHLKFGKSIYTAAKPVLIKFLRGLEVSDAASMKLVRWDADIFANMITNAINDQERPAE